MRNQYFRSTQQQSLSDQIMQLVTGLATFGIRGPGGPCQFGKGIEHESGGLGFGFRGLGLGGVRATAASSHGFSHTGAACIRSVVNSGASGSCTKLSKSSCSAGFSACTEEFASEDGFSACTGSSGAPFPIKPFPELLEEAASPIVRKGCCTL